VRTGEPRKAHDTDHCYSPGCASIIGCFIAVVIALYFHRWEGAALFCVGGLIIEEMRALDLQRQAREDERDAGSE
jgi:hypothetical protein